MNPESNDNQDMGEDVPKSTLAVIQEEVKKEQWLKMSSTLFQCNICSTTAKTKYNIRVHVKSHQGLEGRGFICAICDKRFIRGQELLNHMKGMNGCRGKKHRPLGRPVGSASVKSGEMVVRPTNLTNKQNSASNSGSVNAACGDMVVGPKNPTNNNNDLGSVSAECRDPAVRPKKMNVKRKLDAAIEEVEFVDVDSLMDVDSLKPPYESFCEIKELVLYSTVDTFFNIKTSKVTDMRNPLGPLTELNIRHHIREECDVAKTATFIIELPQMQTCMNEMSMNRDDVFNLVQQMVHFIKGDNDCIPFVLPMDTYKEDGMGSGIGLGVKTTRVLPPGKTLFELSGDLCPIEDCDLGKLQKEQLFSTIKVPGKGTTQFLFGPIQFVNNDCKNYNSKYVHLKKSNRVVLQTLKDIGLGKELLVRYNMTGLDCKC